MEQIGQKSDVNQQSLYINGRTAGISDWFNYDNNQYPDFIYDYESLGNKAIILKNKNKFMQQLV